VHLRLATFLNRYLKTLMKKIVLIGSFFICCLAGTNEEQNDSSVSPPANSSATDTGSRGDTASYERMPQQTNDSIGK